ncbi:hypothetical protein KYE_12295, partial [Marinobacter manganoxydans MnI7-9]
SARQKRFEPSFPPDRIIVWPEGVFAISDRLHHRFRSSQLTG